MTDTTTTVVLAGVRLAVLLLGATITYYSAVAYRRTGAQYLRNASIGFAIMTVGVLVEGLLFEVAGLNLEVVHIVESVAIGIGFLVLLVSLRQ
ncbi:MULTISPECIES: DUF7521 family protein [Haloarcula]|uniref:DUF7521 family protein n=1 Tax=Haloarcula TaxID=2237 RepID=UPI0023EA9725|nr:hypothetical protein [Halomicroarcula sp. XH51]